MFMQFQRHEAAQFVAAHETAVYTFCCRMLGERQRAETLAQEALIAACRAGDEYHTTTLLRTAWQLCTKALQRPYPTTGDAIHQLLAQLPPIERAAVIFRYCLHLDDAAGAAILGLSPHEVHDSVRRARRRMAASLLYAGERPFSPNNPTA